MKRVTHPCYNDKTFERYRGGWTANKPEINDAFVACLTLTGCLMMEPQVEKSQRD
ncbi:MAG: hypothetical protein ABR903_06010 [Thermodesulfovibrionales bacterium]|jgi:hypothetical protein